MYEKYWNLREKPFRNTPDPKYLYFTREYEEALVRLLYTVVEGKGAMLLTGDYGCGKTLLTRLFIRELNPARFDLVLVTHPNLTDAQFLAEILAQLGQAADGLPKVELQRRLQERFYENVSGRRKTIVVVDEAQMVRDPDAFEQMRLLLNYQKNDRFLVSLILIGQPDLRERIEALPQFKQRLAIRYHLSPLCAEETRRYVVHRLQVAGARREIFEPEALAQIHDATGGIPREINNACDMALLMGYGQRVEKIDGTLAKRLMEELAR